MPHRFLCGLPRLNLREGLAIRYFGKHPSKSLCQRLVLSCHRFCRRLRRQGRRARHERRGRWRHRAALARELRAHEVARFRDAQEGAVAEDVILVPVLLRLSDGGNRRRLLPARDGHCRQEGLEQPSPTPHELLPEIDQVNRTEGDVDERVEARERRGVRRERAGGDLEAILGALLRRQDGRPAPGGAVLDGEVAQRGLELHSLLMQVQQESGAHEGRLCEVGP
mmetsp:Transcript_46174/g.148258  ORF Transcript_46174/g.148258 Transcript_46174/m.148258 type:complete len:224 (+) Transcript_46174:1775-2446(+)